MSLIQEVPAKALMQRARAKPDSDLDGAPAAFRRAYAILSRGWSHGSVTFVTPQGRELTLRGEADGPEARIQVRDYAFMNRVLAAGDIGFAEAYMAGEWDTPDLADVLSAMALNFDTIGQVALGAPLMWVSHLVGHLLRANTKKGAARNIHAHYDLGNAFYSRWLDETMTYSSARYETVSQPLQAAQTAKYRALCRQAAISPGSHVLEIGCGWGGFAEYAAREAGARVTAVTISREQHDYAQARMAAAGLSDQVTIRLQDYRDIQGQFDQVVSIEMFEAVGERYWPAYFGKVREVLKPGGAAALQLITIRDELFPLYRRRADFIQTYVFPGGMLPSEARLRDETARAGLQWIQIERFGQDYARTLAEWSRRFEEAWDEIRALGFDERFHRLWRFYLAYCEAGFRTSRTDVAHLTLGRS